MGDADAKRDPWEARFQKAVKLGAETNRNFEDAMTFILFDEMATRVEGIMKYYEMNIKSNRETKPARR